MLVEIGDGGMADDVISIGHNFEAVLSDLETRMREAAADLNSRKPPACATKSSACAPPKWPWSTTHRETARGAGQGRRLCRQEEIRRGRELAGSAMKKRSAAPSIKASRGGNAAPGCTSPTSTRCTARNPCPTGPTARCRKNRSAAQPDHPAEGLAAVRPGVRAEPAVDRRRTGQARRVEEEGRRNRRQVRRIG